MMMMIKAQLIIWNLVNIMISNQTFNSEFQKKLTVYQNIETSHLQTVSTTGIITVSDPKYLHLNSNLFNENK